MRFEPGSRLGRYEIVSALGAGGMGEVYRAHDSRLDRDVAVKVLLTDRGRPADAARFEREAKAIAALAHPNIVAIFDVGESDGAPYLVTELLDGRSLRDELAGGPLPASRAAEIGAEIADAVAAAHEKAIVHRDLKPENIFITSNGRAKVLDFGLARRRVFQSKGSADTPTERLVTEPGIVLGTLGYMSPEQSRGEDAGPESDIFSFGCVLYEMLAGVSPFRRNSAVETVAAILRDEPRPLPASVPPALQTIVMRCLQKNPAARFGSARDLAFALRSGTHAAPARPPFPWKWSVAAAAVVIAIGALAFVLTRPRHVAPRTIAAAGVHSIAIEKFDGSDRALADGVADQLAGALTQLSGLRVVSAVRAGPRKVGTDAAVRGSVTESADLITVDVSVVSSDGATLWSNHFSGVPNDLQAIEQDAAAGIGTALGRSRAITAKQATDNPEAYRLYLRARYEWNKRERQSVHTSIDLLKRAIDLDPTFAYAYAALADDYAVIGYIESLPTAETYPKARAAAMKALEIDDSLAEARTTLAYVEFYYDRDWRAAEADFRRAIEQKPSYATAHQWYADFLTAQGRFDEALREIDRAAAIDPLSPIIPTAAIWAQYMARRYDDAIARANAVLRDSNFGIARAYRALAEAQSGKAREAAADLEALGPIDSPIAQCWRDRVYLMAGRHVDPNDPRCGNTYYASYPLLAAGDRNAAIAKLDQALNDHLEQIVWIKQDPLFDPIRGDPRFRSIQQRAGY
jgi:eukaryotic-like serine/threonine-protein kinase